MSLPNRIRIVNTTGVATDTIITAADTGQAITDVTHIELTFGMGDFITAKLTHVWPIVDIVATVQYEPQDGTP